MLIIHLYNNHIFYEILLKKERERVVIIGFFNVIILVLGNKK